MGYCIAASVEGLPQSGSIHSIVCADGDYAGAAFSAAPVVLDGDVHSLANNLKDGPSVWLFDGMHHAFAAVNADRELSRCFSQRFQGKRLVRLVAPRPEELRVIVPISVGVMLPIWIITVMRTVGQVG